MFESIYHLSMLVLLSICLLSCSLAVIVLFRDGRKVSNVKYFQTPCVFWQKKRLLHSTLFFVFVMLVIIYFLGVSNLFLKFTSDYKHIFFNSDSHFSYRHLVFYMLSISCITIVFWILRFLIRIAFSQIVIWEYSANKVISIRTYNEIIEQDIALDEDLKNMLLYIIINPMSDINDKANMFHSDSVFKNRDFKPNTFFSQLSNKNK